MAGAVGGMLFPWFSGKLLDRFKADRQRHDGLRDPFGICASAYLVSFAIHHALSPSLEPLPEGS